VNAGLASPGSGESGCGGRPNQWVSLTANQEGPVGCYRDIGGFVHLSGSAQECGTAPSTAIFSLPKGYRPAHRQTQSAQIPTGPPVNVFIDTAGQVTADSNFVNFDGMTFRCGPAGHHGCP
jgi:hypothetical protein